MPFDRFTLDLVRGALLAAGGTEVGLRPKAFALLRQMVENAGRLIDRDEIMAAIWPGVVVTDDSVTQVVKEIRRALGDEEQRLLRTVPRRGFLFAAEVSRADDQATLVVLPPDPNQPQPALPAEADDGADTGGATAPPRPAANRPMMAVLPFADMTGDPAQEYFADGVTEDLTTALSHLRWFSVIACNSAFTYKGRAVDVRQVGRELGVGYVLEGSVRKAGERVRINAQLCEAETGRQVWAERFDGNAADIFDLQDRITEAVVGAIEPSLRLAEVERARARPTASLTAYDLYLRALPHSFATREGNDEGLRLLRRAITIDPDFAAAKGTLAGLHVLRFAQGWAQGGDREEAMRIAREVVDGAGEDAPSALAWAGHALAFFARDYAAGSAAAERALLLAPNSALVLLLGGWARLHAGDGPGAKARFERAMRLSPVDPAMFYLTAAVGYACFLSGRYAEAADWAQRALGDRPGFMLAHCLLVASLGQIGGREAADAALCALLAAAPGYTVSAAAEHTALRSPEFFDGLRKAGLPD
jgi:TolB-like protein/DNA-binding winged helix-turn-helix (wHTH) protein/Flp pilus assembly protein TadD